MSSCWSRRRGMSKVEVLEHDFLGNGRWGFFTAPFGALEEFLQLSVGDPLAALAAAKDVMLESAASEQVPLPALWMVSFTTAIRKNLLKRMETKMSPTLGT